MGLSGPFAWLELASSHGAAAYLASVTAAGRIVQEIQQAGQAQDGREIDVQLEVGDEVDALQPPASVALSLADLNAQLGDPLNYGEVTAHTQRSLSAMIDTESSNLLLQSRGDEEERELASG